MNLNKEISTPIAILIIVVIAALVSGAFYWQYEKTKKTETLKSKQQSEENFSGPEGWRKYVSKKYGYVLFYPPQWETEDASRVPGGHSRVFAKLPAEEFSSVSNQMKDGVFVHVAFTKLPLRMFVRHESNIASRFLKNSPYETKINGKSALVYNSTSTNDKKPNQCVVFKNDDYAVMIFTGSDYKREVYDKLLANLHLTQPQGISSQDKEAINTEDWEVYTDKPTGKNPFGYSVPGWLLSMKLPSNFEGGEGSFYIPEEKNQDSPGIEFKVGVNLVSGKLLREQKELIEQYRKLNPGEAIRDIESQSVIKEDEINLGDCEGPQVLIESAPGVRYKTICLLEEQEDLTTVIFTLQTYRSHAELLEKYKPVYEKIISTFEYEKTSM